MSRVLLVGALALVVLGAMRVEARCPPQRESPIADPFEVEVRASCDCCALGGPRGFRQCAQPITELAVFAQRFSRRCGRQYLRALTHACRSQSCPSPATPCADCRWYETCGDPVCVTTIDPIPGVPACTTQRTGDPCIAGGETCDPGLGCGVRLLCTDQDPTAHSCPISRRDAKRDIAYLGSDDLDRLLDDLRRVHLARWRYTAEGAAARPHLGFIIDDVGESPAVAPDGDHVDLYGYTSMAVAAIQAQQRRIDALEREVAELRRALRRR